MIDEQNLLARAFEWAWAGVLFLLGLVWKNIHNEQIRTLSDIKEINEKLAEHEKMFREMVNAMNDGVLKLKDTINTNHVEMLKLMPKRRTDD
jgi:hypothetical protein